ncbi:MAG: hypothetical protein KIH63_001620 [Candidatus Saccharibacteria bacterium]|nr:hypothetical protein [Candidatus Saccharibacteria bacterium]
MRELVDAVVVDWEPAQWQKNQRRKVSSVVVPALFDAQAYLREVLEIQPPPARLVPYLAPLASAEFAHSISATEMWLHVTGSEVDHYRKLARRSDEITGQMVHEMVHCVMFGQNRDNTLLEKAAGEGVAYVAQAYVCHEMLDVPLDQTLLGVPVDAEDLLEGFYQCPHLEVDLATEDKGVQAAFKEWITGDVYPGTYIGYGEALGVACVRSWVQDYGYDLATIIQWPAEKIIS